MRDLFLMWRSFSRAFPLVSMLIVMFACVLAYAAAVMIAIETLKAAGVPDGAAVAAPFIISVFLVLFGFAIFIDLQERKS